MLDEVDVEVVSLGNRGLLIGTAVAAADADGQWERLVVLGDKGGKSEPLAARDGRVERVIHTDRLGAVQGRKHPLRERRAGRWGGGEHGESCEGLRRW